jgi:UDP-N-acetylmuramoyl-tripeptide--D-alanyl-D-alanine ligase
MTAPLWTAEEAAAATGGSATAAFAATGVSIDTRTIEAGDLFVALEGESRDGHAFVADARARGAAAAMVRHAPAGLPGDFPLLIVGDTLRGLERLGIAARARSRARIVAVTGSVGKTGSKEALARALGRVGPTHASAASFNNQIGVPLSLARLPRRARFAVFEIGMNHAGEIGPLSRMVRPHVALITTIAPVHLEFFPSVEAIADAKAEIFEGLVRGGAAVLNRDNAYFARLRRMADARGARIVGFGEDEDADVRLICARIEADGARVGADVLGQCLTYRIGMPGRHWVMNSLGVLGAVAALGADVPRAAEALAGLVPLKGRGARHRVALADGAFVVIDDSYNASPPSMAAALATLGAAPVAAGGRRIAVLGDMLELGAWGADLHRALATEIAARDIDLVFACGPNMEHLWAALPEDKHGSYAPDSATLAQAVTEAARAGDVLMVKGSFGSRMSVVVDALLARGGAHGGQAVNG